MKHLRTGSLRLGASRLFAVLFANNIFTDLRWEYLRKYALHMHTWSQRESGRAATKLLFVHALRKLWGRLHNALFEWALVLLSLFHDPLAVKLQTCSRLGMFKFSLMMHSILTSLSPKGPHCTLPHTNLPWTVGWGPKVRTRTPLAINSAQTSDEGATSPTELVQPNANH